jgi:hypothetical protein
VEVDGIFSTPKAHVSKYIALNAAAVSLTFFDFTKFLKRAIEAVLRLSSTAKSSSKLSEAFFLTDE